MDPKLQEEYKRYILTQFKYYKEMMNDKLNTQNEALSAVRARKFVVGSVSDLGSFSMSINPYTHPTLALAKAEARRLSRITPGKLYVVMQLAGGEMVPNVAISI